MATRPWLLPVVIVVLLAVAATAAGGYIYYREKPPASSSPKVVVAGGNVTVNYVGIFGSGPDQGRVFDTSIYKVATNNAAFPKALQYHGRGPAANYTPLAVYVGASTPSGGYTLGNLTFIQVVPGFWQGIVGMSPNSTRTIVVPEAQGYGATNLGCVATRPLVTTLPVLQTYAGVEFQKIYPGITARVGYEFTDPHYGWADQLLSANASYVTLQRLPYVGEVSSPGGWPVTVTSIQSTPNGSGIITIRNELTPADAGHLAGKDFLGTGPCSASSNGAFIVTAVDLVAGTFTENFNPEVQGQTLEFIVTVLDYFPPGTVA